ncbi:MAG: LacI family DNA-binding transcriptional regulator [Gammaproteobacteria bacterium]
MNQRRSKQARVTIKDIAREAGVDPSTVTRALQSSSRVKASTRLKIQNIAAELGYVPSAMARSLVARRSHLLGLLIPDMTNPFFTPLARGVEDEAARHNLSVLIRNTEGRPEAERDAIRVFTEFSVDGLLVPMARCPQSFYDSLPDMISIVHLNRPEAPYHVNCDSVLGSRHIVEHLLGLGHQRIGFITGPGAPAREPKMTAFRQCMGAAGLSVYEDEIFHYDGTLKSVEIIANTICTAHPSLTAVFAWNDVCAIALMHALHKRGVEVPRDMSIAGHDDIEMAGIVQPPLTTVRWPMYEMGIAAVRYAVSLHEEKQAPVLDIPPPRMIIRESTATAPVR